MRKSAWLAALALLVTSAAGFGVERSAERGPRDHEESPEAVVRRAAASVEHGAYDEAVDRLELLADRGFSHPDASYVRAFAYVERARSRSARPGDLGRAVAALEESAFLRPDDAAIATALEKLRAEISRRRARAGNSPLVQRPSLGRALTGLLPENAWAILAAVGSTLTTLGLGLRLLIHRRSAEIAGAVGIALGLGIGGLGAAFTTAARHYRATSRPAVVVVPEAHLVDRSGRALSKPRPDEASVPEGALVFVHGVENGLARIEWGSIDGWLSSAQLRMFAGLPSREP